jgi:hypothetical protein
MTTRALLTKDDVARLAEAATLHQCVIEVKRGDAVITIRPNGMVDTKPGTVSLEGWRRRHADKGKGRA